jgi:hypothetical protein
MQEVTVRALFLGVLLHLQGKCITSLLCHRISCAHGFYAPECSWRTEDDIRFARHYDQSRFGLIRWKMKTKSQLEEATRNVQYHSHPDIVIATSI